MRRVLWPWNAAASPEIMAEDVEEGKRGVQGGGQPGKQQDSNQAAQPEREGVERRKSIRSSGLRQLGSGQLERCHRHRPSNGN